VDADGHKGDGLDEKLAGGADEKKKWRSKIVATQRR